MRTNLPPETGSCRRHRDGERFEFPEDAHWNARGHRVAARAVVVFLFAVALFRLLPRKSLGDTSVVDFVLTILIGTLIIGAILYGCMWLTGAAT